MIDALENKSQPITNNSQVSNSPLDIAAITELVEAVRYAAEDWGGTGNELLQDKMYNEIEALLSAVSKLIAERDETAESWQTVQRMYGQISDALSTAIAERDEARRNYEDATHFSEFMDNYLRDLLAKSEADLDISQERVRELERRLTEGLCEDCGAEARRFDDGIALCQECFDTRAVWEPDAALSPDTQRETP